MITNAPYVVDGYWSDTYAQESSGQITLESTILSQFANSPTLLALINSFNAAVDPSVNIDAFYKFVWDVTTAQGYGLAVWGRIVGVTNVLSVPGGKNLGFEEAGTVSADPFGQSSFYTGVPTTENFTLTDDAFRALILIKALSNISNCAIPTYNKILMQLFPGRGNAYVCDTGGMNARLTFEFLLKPFEIAILKQSGALSAPTGVLFEIMDLDLPHAFGFAEAGASSATLGSGTFFRGYE